MRKAAARRNARGQFPKGQSGNPEGRPKSDRANVQDAFLKAWCQAWTEHGDTVFKIMIDKYTDVFVSSSASLFSKQDRARLQPILGQDPILAARILAAGREMKSLQPPATPGSAEPAAAAAHQAETNRLAAYRPYTPQADFHAAGAQHDERLFMAGNQLGKTLAGGMEWAMHLTGRYPDWWKGKVFDAPVRMWAAGITQESTRDNPQRVLIGSPQQKDQWGTGTIPKDALKEWTAADHIRDALDSVVVRWGGGGGVQQGESVLCFKSYEKGRGKWQGETLDGVWFDEEPPLDIYCEGRTRCVAKRGIVILTMTPLLGMTEVVKLFLSETDLAKMRTARG